jgi:hypothetical protein
LPEKSYRALQRRYVTDVNGMDSLHTEMQKLFFRLPGGRIKSHGKACSSGRRRQSPACAYLARLTLFGLVLNATLHIRWVDPLAALPFLSSSSRLVAHFEAKYAAAVSGMILDCDETSEMFPVGRQAAPYALGRDSRDRQGRWVINATMSCPTKLSSVKTRRLASQRLE